MSLSRHPGATFHNQTGGRICIRPLIACVSQRLQELFAPYGVQHAEIFRKKPSMANVVMVSKEAAVHALMALNGMDFNVPGTKSMFLSFAMSASPAVQLEATPMAQIQQYTGTMGYLGGHVDMSQGYGVPGMAQGMVGFQGVVGIDSAHGIPVGSGQGMVHMGSNQLAMGGGQALLMDGTQRMTGVGASQGMVGLGSHQGMMGMGSSYGMTGVEPSQGMLGMGSSQEMMGLRGGQGAPPMGMGQGPQGLL